MPATEDELHRLFDQLQNMANELAGADLPPPEAAKVKALATIGLTLLKSVVVDMNSIAYFLSELVRLEQNAQHR